MASPAWWTWLRDLLLRENDALASYRERITLPLGVLGLVLVVPFGLNNLIQGRVWIGLAVMLVAATLALDVWALRRGRPPPVPYALVTVPVIGAMMASVVQQGIFGMLWSYPLVLACYFVMSRRLALLLSAVVLVAMTGLVAWVLGPPVAVRVFATLLLTIGLINLVLNVLAQLQAALVEQAITDPLTGAHNRRHMEETLQRFCERNRRRAGEHALLLLDIDHFKLVNDQHGHEAGDDVLRALVQVARRHTRRTDRLFRIGGEEFALLLPDTSPEGALFAANALRERLAQAAMPREITVTVSIGLAALARGDEPADWLRRADAALYRAKEGGRNRVEVAA